MPEIRNCQIANFVIMICSIASATAATIMAYQMGNIADETSAFALKIEQSHQLNAFNTEFDRLQQYKFSGDADKNPEAYYTRFWSLQYRQYDSWKDQFISEHDFTFWLHARKKEWDANDSIGEISYREGFELATKRHASDRFKKLMLTAMEESPDTAMNRHKDGTLIR